MNVRECSAALARLGREGESGAFADERTSTPPQGAFPDERRSRADPGSPSAS